MFTFDLNRDPLTSVELKKEQEKVNEKRKQLIKYSCISDVFHAFIFIALYFGQALSGAAIMAAVGLSTVVAIILATATRKNLNYGDKLAISVIALAAATAVILILQVTMEQPLVGSIGAGLVTGSIVIVGATLGRKIKKVLTLSEDLKPIHDDSLAQRELADLCHNYPPLAEYRELAARYLRPQLTYGELKAMKDYARSNGS